jgi:hypothetical protein
MWSWARALAQVATPECLVGVPTARSPPPRQQRAVIQILASMAMKVNTGEQHE